MIEIILNTLIFILTPISMVLLGNKNKIGFVLFIILDILYIILGIMLDQFGLIGSGAMFIITEIYAYRKWKREEQK
jgi:hypothetical protein